MQPMPTESDATDMGRNGRASGVVGAAAIGAQKQAQPESRSARTHPEHLPSVRLHPETQSVAAASVRSVQPTTRSEEKSLEELLDIRRRAGHQITKAPAYSISIVAYNNIALTRKCIREVLRHSQNESFELILTDNDSSDGTHLLFREIKSALGSSATVITNKSNLGFQQPNIRALGMARGVYFVMLNNDVEVCESWLSKLNQPFRVNPKMAFVGITGTCCVINDNFIGVPHESKREYVEASVAMIPCAIARKHGLFSDYLHFAYWEDTDLSFRLRELGYEITAVDLPIKHKNGSTSHLVDTRPYLAANGMEMKKRWGFYFKRRNFKRRILMRRTGARGDVLMITPIIRALKEKWPQCQIEVKTKCPEMISNHPDVKLAYHSTKYFDQFIDLDLAYEKRPEVHIMQAYAEAAGVVVPPSWKLELYPTREEEAWAMRFARGKPIALFHAGPTCWPSKNWPLERMQEVVKRVKRLGFLTIAIGAEDSPDCGCDDSCAGTVSPQGTYALARYAKLFVGIDSMPLHLATAADVASVVIFGPTEPRAILRKSPRIVAVQASRDDVPCVGEHGRRTKAVTQAPCDGECIRAVTVSMVMGAIDHVIRKS